MITEPIFRIVMAALFALLVVVAIWGFRKQGWPK